MDDVSPLDGILDVDLLLCMYNLLGEKSMIRAYISKHYTDAVKLIGYMNSHEKLLREEIKFAEQEGDTAW
ncbi:hypothetical protein DXC69_03875 [Paenibacillus polymyxa]|nr:hypothetical protein DXC69_03875 [Paenibacillus polymyxa]